MLKPLIEITIASAFWGLAFIGLKELAGTLNPFAILFYRFLGAFILCLLVLKKKNLTGTNENKISLPIFGEYFFGTLGLGVLLCATILLQTYGLQTTTVTKSSFITILYVIIVPFLEWFWLKEKIPGRLFVAIPMSIMGIAFMVNLEFNSWNFGDSLTLLNSFTSAIHITLLALIVRTKPNVVLLAMGQNFWISLVCGIAFFVNSSQWNLGNLNWTQWAWLAELTIGASFLAFLLQINAQKKLSPSVASILFLLESPISAVFAILILNENFTKSQFFGAVLIVITCVFVQTVPYRTHKLQ